MHRILAGLAGAAMVVTLASVPAVAAPAMPMSGAQEVAPGDNNGHGFFTYTINGTSFCYTLRWTGIEPATAAHVHAAPRHVNGSVVIPLSIGDGSGATVSACATITQTLADAITANPKAYYVNVHNTPYPGGAIRGQLK